MASRTSPSKRKRCFEEYQNAKQDKWINLDSIKSYQDFTNKISNWIKQFPDINIQVKSECVLLYEISKFDSLNFDICPSLPFCVKIDSSLHILVWKNNIMITPSELSWLNLQCGLLNHWSQLENLLIQRRTNHDTAFSDNSLLKNAITLLKKMSAEENQEIRYFLIQQLELLNTKPKQRGFSSDSLIMAFSLHFKSPNVYEFLRNSILILPSARLLRKLPGNISPHFEDLDANSYLKKKAQRLEDKELFVNLLLDEIHVKSLLTYKNGKLIGSTEKDIATTTLFYDNFIIFK